MSALTVDLGERSYEILIESGAVASLGEKLAALGFNKKIAIVSNKTVFDIYGKPVTKSLEKAGLNEVFPVLIPDGEQYKDLKHVEYVLNEIFTMGLDRKSAVIALGGGVVGDLTGFAASIYMRGIALIQVPTTLLSQVDSSVGGKTGVNNSFGKNMIGTFYQPRFVCIDTDTLKTLPERELLAGIAEVIKYGIIKDPALFRFLKDNKEKILSQDTAALKHIIHTSCAIKADVVSKDEREAGLREILNYGHTAGHALETVTQYTQFLHGEAVAWGMYAEAKIAAAMSLLSKEALVEIKTLIEGYGLPVSIPKDIDIRQLIETMFYDKKTVAGAIKFILPSKIGTVEIRNDIGIDMIFTALAKEI
ncbi:MAG: 3-dehydroquinate synthase [Candidatus Magnetominusculus sp. LBB02]|nr:3-dehydroquinate synthase [Candidatus Magnetominusculus sp. LBB02]